MPITNLPQQLREALPEKWQQMGDAIGEDFWDFLSGPDMEALGDTIDQIERGTPASPYTAAPKIGMVWAASGVKKLPQYLKFLRKFKKTANAPVSTVMRDVAGHKLPKPTAVQDAARTWFDTRQHASAGKLSGVYQTQPGRNNPWIVGQYNPLLDAKSQRRGNIGVYKDTHSGRSFGEQVGTFGHEGGHSVRDQRLRRRGESFADQYSNKGGKTPASFKAEEEFAERLGASSEKDLRSFFKEGQYLRHKFPKEERGIFDALLEIHEKSKLTKRLTKSGRQDFDITGKIDDAWNRILGGRTPKLGRPAGSGASAISRPATQRGGGSRVIGQAVKKSQKPAGSFVDITGKETSMRGEELHIDVVQKLRRRKKEWRGFEVREGNVRLPEVGFLKHKKGLDAALDSAYKLGWLRYGKSPAVIVEVPGLGYAAVPIGKKRFFLEDPVSYILNAEEMRPALGGGGFRRH